MENENSLRERLIDVGVNLVMTEGSASLGLREIARRAGVSHGAPRRYFPTHHTLLSAIAGRGFTDLEARLAGEIGGTTSARGQLEILGRAYVGYALEHRGMFELMFRHDLLDSDTNSSDRPRLRESTLPVFQLLVGLVARCRAERDVAQRPDSPGQAATPDVTAAALWSNLHGIAQLWVWGSLQLALDVRPEGGAPDSDQLDRLVAAALHAHLGPVAS
ncbi:TetR/AcrR family transcriptional regulator [Streptomyces pinistramenti]|uniref:TetR/AcrR family transcriptional regulator n=1 Tax=Streptomyces pinistramenti TaxID=2884812 RepID=UPI001D081203|nr:TetR/AcrR family transcriptional regulator [Streptomyces pinistramenti]MCB5909222.1 TetR/AcrR family transcriptional regulator [Streptomyces pinistramenti]